MSTPTTDDRELFLAERRKGIGGSDVAAVLGLDPYKTPYQLWREKRGMDQDAVTMPAARRGNFLESAVLARYAAQVDAVKIVPQIRHDRGWRRGNQDARATMRDGTHRCVEIKTATRQSFRASWGDPWSDEVPDRAICQGLWYADLDDAHLIDFAVLVVPDDPDQVIGATAQEVVQIGDLHIFQVPRRPELEQHLVAEAERFWRDHVQDGIEPPAKTIADLDLLYPRHHDGEVVMADADMLARIAEYDQVCQVHRDADKRRHELREWLLLQAGGAEAIVNRAGSPIVTCKTQDRAAYQVEAGSSRVLRLTKWWRKGAR